MKTFFLFLLILFCIKIVKAQEIYQFKSNSVSTLKSSETINPFSISSENRGLFSVANKTVNTNNFYKKIGEFDDYIVLENTSNTEDKIILSKSELSIKSNPVTSRFNFGLITLPMKLRFGGGSDENKTKRYFDLTADFNLGLTLSYKLNKKYQADVQTHWILALGSSQVKLTPESTNNFITSDQTSIAFSPSTGLIFQFTNNLQVITLIGWDFVPGKVGREWLYKDKPFLGLGIGLKVFEIGKSTEKND